MAIATESKHFIASPLVQAVVNDIYNGRVVFSMTSHHSVLVDNYKPRAIDSYDVHKAPFLDHYRLRVPRYCAILEFLNFVFLLFLFLLALSSERSLSLLLFIFIDCHPRSDKDLESMTFFEVVFIIFAVAFALDEYTASREHGWNSKQLSTQCA